MTDNESFTPDDFLTAMDVESPINDTGRPPQPRPWQPTMTILSPACEETVNWNTLQLLMTCRDDARLHQTEEGASP